MQPLRFSLFFQIFIWFWSAMALLGAAILGVEWFTTAQPVIWNRRALIESALSAEVDKARKFANNPTALAHELRDFDKRAGVQSFWIDRRTLSAGRDGRGVAIPLFLREGAQNIPPGSTKAYWSGAGVWVGILVPVDARYIYAARFERGLFSVNARTRLVRLAVVLFTAGLVCWLLARYLTTRLAALRVATQRLASGDFSARAGINSGGRQDEVALLARDFDTMATQLEALVGAQKRLVGDVSHELRSPLTRLRLALALAKRDAPPSAVLSGHLERIESESQTLEAMVGELLTLSRLENQLETPPMAPFDWTRTLKAVAADIAFEAEQLDGERAPVKVHLQGADQQAQVLGNEELLKRALENVARNALRFSPPGGEVTFTLSRLEKEGQWQTIIRDSGPGVPSGELGSIFQPFYRVETARERDGGLNSGTGLGLAIASRAVLASGGSIEARNAEGGGLEVVIRLSAAP